MGLTAWKASTEKVSLKDGSLTVEVRGLNLDDIRALIQTHFVDLENVVDLYLATNGPTFSMNAATMFMVEMVNRTPALAANIIALCAVPEEGEEFTAILDAARKLNAVAQVLLLSAILRLSCEDVGGPKAALALLTGFLAQNLPPEMAAKLKQGRASIR